MDEFDLISKLFAPLADSPGADGLRDDVAELETTGRLIATTDAIVEGVHFLATDPLDTVAAKLVRVNVSDIHAKGGQPLEALLTLVWPRGRPTGELAAFAEGLRSELLLWGLRLVGGDTTGTPGPLVLSLALTGRCGTDGPVRRSGGRAGDDLWVTGVIGDGWLGLQAALGRLGAGYAPHVPGLVDRYRRPALPGLQAARLVERHASASVDVSDGLVADAGRLAAASGLGVDLRADAVPLGEAGSRWATMGGQAALVELLTGGDDYQILFAAPASVRGAIGDAAVQSGLAVARIGRLREGDGVSVLAGDGSGIEVGSEGWRHLSA
jgi:thiamine-monophosphate kinase